MTMMRTQESPQKYLEPAEPGKSSLESTWPMYMLLFCDPPLSGVGRSKGDSLGFLDIPTREDHILVIYKGERFLSHH